MPRYAELVYNGFWFSPERLALQAAVDSTQEFCTGTVPRQALQGAPLETAPPQPRAQVQGILHRHRPRQALQGAPLETAPPPAVQECRALRLGCTGCQPPGWLAETGDLSEAALAGARFSRDAMAFSSRFVHHAVKVQVHIVMPLRFCPGMAPERGWTVHSMHGTSMAGHAHSPRC